jgi:excisionase family DNA binding protein
MEKQVLTTAEAAKLLGVSVRTAQLLIESGPLRSWKTPGGHRRVYLADVVAYMAQNPRAPGMSSALAMLVASAERQRKFDALLGSAREYQMESCPDVYIAAFEIGARLPDAVIVDMHDNREERQRFLRQMTSHSELGTTRFILVAERNDPVVYEQPQRVLVATPQELAGALRAVFTASSTLPDLPIANEGPLPFPIAANERERLSALERTGLLGTPAEPTFDRLTWLASNHLKMPISLMTLLSASHQHFKSRVGLDLSETPRSWAVCNHTILQRHVYTVPDLSTASAFSTNPAVAGVPHLRFYAGAPMFDPSGFALGSICVMGYEPHHLDDSQERTLLALAAIASDEIRTRVTKRASRPAR